MSTHITHRLDAASLAAWAELDAASRQRVVLGAYLTHGPMTDREVAETLGFADMNRVRPRITELVDSGALAYVSMVKCAVTGRTVRKCRAAGGVERRAV